MLNMLNKHKVFTVKGIYSKTSSDKMHSELGGWRSYSEF